MAESSIYQGQTDPNYSPEHYLKFRSTLLTGTPNRMGVVGCTPEPDLGTFFSLLIMIACLLVGYSLLGKESVNITTYKEPKIENVVTYQSYIKDIKDPLARIRAEDAIATYLERLNK